MLALTLLNAAVVAGIAISMNLARPHWLIVLVGFYGLLYLTEKNKHSSKGLGCVFLLTGFMGYTIGPIINHFLGAGAGDLVALAFFGTAAIFFSLSAYVIVTKKDMSFLSGMMFAGMIVLIIAIIANIFLQIPALHLTICAVMILFSSGAILMQTSEIVRGGETSYISATVSLFVSLYNIFLSLLQILGIMGNND